MTMISMEYLSGAMMRHVRVQVILPHEEMHPDRSSEPPWKTLYFFPGMTESAASVLQKVQLAAAAARYQTAIVMPDGENAFYMNNAKRKEYYENYVAEELVRVTRKLLPLSGRYEDTWIGGISMGGFGALAAGLRHRDTFSKIAVLSPAVQVYDMADQNCLPMDMMDDIFGSREHYLDHYDPYSLLLREKEAGRELPGLFMRCGTEDRLAYRVCRAFAEKLGEEQICINYGEGSGEHDFYYWNRQLPDMMEFLTGTDGKGQTTEN